MKYFQLIKHPFIQFGHYNSRKKWENLCIITENLIIIIPTCCARVECGMKNIEKWQNPLMKPYSPSFGVQSSGIPSM